MMGLTHTIARWLAPLSFAINFAAQLYGILSSPSMKDIHDANISFWSPEPYLIAGFFFPQQLLQIAWLYRLNRIDPNKSSTNKKDIDIMVNFVPYYTVGNLSLATWVIFWNASELKTSNVFVLINSITQLFYLFARLPTMNTSSTSSVLTHVVSKTLAGIGVVDLLHNGSVAYFDHRGPTTAVEVFTGVFFGILAIPSDWIFGGCLVYDLVALAVGQRGPRKTGWSNLLFVYAVAVAGIVGVKNWARPPYVKDVPIAYEATATEDDA